MTVASRSGSVPADGLTVGSIGIVAYTLATMLHEGIGHGGACLISGGMPRVISTVHTECSVESRLVIAGGTLANLAAAALFFVLGRRRTSTLRQFFCWLSMSINLFMATGYFLFSGISGVGDWAAIIQGLRPAWLLRSGMTIAGGAAYLLSVRLSLLEMRPLIGSDKEQRIARAARLMRIPYFSGGLLSCIAGALNPVGWRLVALSAAASTFGGTSGLVWMDNRLKDTRAIPLGSEPEPEPINRSWNWIALAACIATVFVLVIGPGLHFNDRSPSK